MAVQVVNYAAATRLEDIKVGLGVGPKPRVPRLQP